MCAKIPPNFKEDLLETGTGAVWAQWSALGAGTLQESPSASAIVDPEALVLFSLYLLPAERRLGDLVRWWAEVGSELLSVQRMKTILEWFPSAVTDRFGAFSHWAAEAGDSRWSKHAQPGEALGPERGRKGPDAPDLDAPSALLFRIRAGLGVGAKADVLTYLLGIGGQAVTTKETTEATSYSRGAVRGALSGLARAGFIQKTGRRPAQYYAPLHSWEPLVTRPDHPNESVPPWRYWAQLYAFLARTRQWSEETSGQSAYLKSTRARDLFEEFQPAFEANRIQVPSPNRYQGAEYLEGFTHAVEQVTQWIPAHI